MKQTMTFTKFYDGFRFRRENFSYDGLEALFEYFEELEDNCDMEIEFDPIAICCEFTEYENIKEFKEFKEAYTRLNNIQNLEDIAEYTTVIRIKNVDRFIAANM